jgi:hypothetical protein
MSIGMLFNIAMTSKSTRIILVCFQIGVCALTMTTSLLFTFDNDRGILKFIQIFGISSSRFSIVCWLPVLILVVILKQIQIKMLAELTMVYCSISQNIISLKSGVFDLGKGPPSQKSSSSGLPQFTGRNDRKIKLNHEFFCCNYV